MIYALPKVRMNHSRFYDHLINVTDVLRLVIDVRHRQLHVDMSESDGFFMARMTFPCFMDTKPLTEKVPVAALAVPSSRKRRASTPAGVQSAKQMWSLDAWAHRQKQHTNGTQRARVHEGLSSSSASSPSASASASSGVEETEHEYEFYVSASHFVTHVKRINKSKNKLQWQLRATPDQLYILDNMMPTYKYNATIDQLDYHSHTFFNVSKEAFTCAGVWLHLTLPIVELHRIVCEHCVANGNTYSVGRISRTDEGRIEMSTRCSGMNIKHQLPRSLEVESSTTTTAAFHMRTFYSLWLRFIQVCTKNISHTCHIYVNQHGVFLYSEHPNHAVTWGMHINHGNDIPYLESF